MAVFRIEKTRDYTVMSNHHLKDRTLTLRPTGISGAPSFGMKKARSRIPSMSFTKCLSASRRQAQVRLYRVRQSHIRKTRIWVSRIRRNRVRKTPHN